MKLFKFKLISELYTSKNPSINNLLYKPTPTPLPEGEHRNLLTDSCLFIENSKNDSRYSPPMEGLGVGCKNKSFF